MQGHYFQKFILYISRGIFISFSLEPFFNVGVHLQLEASGSLNQFHHHDLDLGVPAMAMLILFKRML